MPYLLPCFIPVAIIGGFLQGELWPFRLVLVAFALVVSVDLLAGEGRPHFPPRLRGANVRSLGLRLAPWMWLPAQVCMVAIGLHAAADPALGALDVATVALCLGMTNGMLAAPAAHELMHRRGRVARAVATMQMALFSYAHFVLEHVNGHHVRVATPGDPATARLGESVYVFYTRAICGGFASAWRLERERQRRRGRLSIGPHNRVIRGLVLEVLIYAIVGYCFGFAGVLLFVAQSVIALSIVETFNYIQHYGLSRARQADGRFERASPRHSWNADHPASNLFTLNLGRHSHHHCEAQVSYALLQTSGRAPQLPAGLYGMWILALFPPLWFAVMDPLAAIHRVEDHRPAEGERAWEAGSASGG